MRSFKLQLPTNYVFGSGTFRDAGKEIKKVADRILIVTGKSSARREGYLQALEDMCGEEDIRYFLYEGISPNPEVNRVDEGGKLAASARVDAVVALGGGSVMDAAKGMAIVAANGGSVWDYVAVNRTVRKSLPVITIPTLSATGSEGNAYGVVTHDVTREKTGFICKGAVPVLSLIDPDLTMTVPDDYLKDAAVDIICHSLEAFISSRDHAPLNDNISLALVKTVVDITPELLENKKNSDLRSAFAWTSTLALNGINDAGREGPYAMHALEHPMSGLFSISHGRGLAVILPVFLNYFAAEKKNKITALGRQVFAMQDPRPSDVIDRLRQWLRSIDREITLKDVGIRSDDIPGLTEQVFRINANKHGNISGPRQLSRSDVETVYSMCL